MELSSSPGLLIALPATWSSSPCPPPPDRCNSDTLACSPLPQQPEASAAMPSSLPVSELAQHPSAAGHLQQAQLLPAITLQCPSSVQEGCQHWIHIVILYLQLRDNQSAQ